MLKVQQMVKMVTGNDTKTIKTDKWQTVNDKFLVFTYHLPFATCGYRNYV
jgi:hypothetical protein